EVVHQRTLHREDLVTAIDEHRGGCIVGQRVLHQLAGAQLAPRPGPRSGCRGVATAPRHQGQLESGRPALREAPIHSRLPGDRLEELESPTDRLRGTEHLVIAVIESEVENMDSLHLHVAY